MAGKAATISTTYSPSLTTQKTKAPIFNEDCVRPEGRGFHQCRPASPALCKVDKDETDSLECFIGFPFPLFHHRKI
ncbi:hypothetical protein K1719_002857 [Acacia pycnantha]|nr:hypothetical protein K1719_002857 [Acacia pycnantha]